MFVFLACVVPLSHLDVLEELVELDGWGNLSILLAELLHYCSMSLKQRLV